MASDASILTIAAASERCGPVHGRSEPGPAPALAESPALGPDRASRLLGAVPPGLLRLGLVLALGGLLSGLLALGLGRLLAPLPAASSGWATVCSPRPADGPEPALSVIRLSSPATREVTLDLQYLNPDGTVLRTQHIRLLAGAVTSFSLPASDLGAALRVAASDEVEVQVTQVFRRDGGPAETRPVPCRCQA
jgi:hypothetical protein